MEEEWRAIKNFEGLYEVSNCGRVRSVDRVIIRNNGVPVNWKGRILKPLADRHGHISYSLTAKHRVFGHRLVALAFLENPKNYPLVRHIDGNPANNVVTNLAWGNMSQNRLDKRIHGTDFYVNKTHCPSNHEYTEENIYHEGRKRKCRQCRTRHAAAYRERQRIKKVALDLEPETGYAYRIVELED